MRPFIDYKNVWLTVNRACNLRCRWCYAQGTDYKMSSDMDLILAKQLVDISHDLGINHITLIGGEPTIYPHIFEVIDYIHQKNMKCGFVTNGLRFKDESFVRNLIDSGINNFSISLKGETKDVFKSISGVDAFDDVVAGVQNCLKYTNRVNVSMVLTEENIPNYLEAVKTFKCVGVKKFRFSFCYEFDTSHEYRNYIMNHNPVAVVDKFKESYMQLDELTEHSFELFQSLPLCLWDKSLIKVMDKNRQLTSVCQLLNRHGLIFDEVGNIIPCNAMYFIKLAKYGEDFTSATDLKKIIKSQEIIDIYKKMCGVPDEQCLDCEDLTMCGGGCVCQWTNYSFDELMKAKEENSWKK